MRRLSPRKSSLSLVGMYHEPDILPIGCEMDTSGMACCLGGHQNCGGVAGSAAELMPSHMALFTVKLPWASSFTVQMVS